MWTIIFLTIRQFFFFSLQIPANNSKYLPSCYFYYAFIRFCFPVLNLLSSDSFIPVLVSATYSPSFLFYKTKKTFLKKQVSNESACIMPSSFSCSFWSTFTFLPFHNFILCSWIAISISPATIWYLEKKGIRTHKPNLQHHLPCVQI